MNTLLARVEQKKLELDAYRPLPNELVKQLYQWYAIELTYNSNAIEGNTLTKKETALVIEKGLTIAGKTVREHLEAINHAYALDFIEDLSHKKKSDITLTTLLDIHRVILKGIDDDNAGRLRKVAVFIAGSDTEFPHPIKVLDLMTEFITWLHTSQEDIVLIAMQAHFKLVAIHPFVDGNGRTARLLMNLLLMQAGYPPAVIEQSDRAEYINAIAHAEKTDDLTDFYNLILRALEKSLNRYLDAAQKTIK